jgi:oligopeptide/dipeptide ABC transporter ATP-binding protein
MVAAVDTSWRKGLKVAEAGVSTSAAGTTNSEAPVLDIADLYTEFHLRSSTVHAVEGVTLSIKAGECVGLVGESGCGKSTTGLSVMKLLPSVGHITSGSIRLLGRELVPLSEREMEHVRGEDVGMIFQDPMTALNPTMNVGRQIAEPVRLHRKVSKEQAMDRALEVLRLVGMPRPEERLHSFPHQLSGGLRQRVMIAIALACEPKLLIADEPTTALDVTIQAQILDLIDDLRERLHMAVLLITHDMGVIAARASRVMVMYAGKLVEAASTETLFSKMHHPYTQALLESIPRLDGDRSLPLTNIPGVPPNLSEFAPYCRFAPRCRYATDVCREQEPPLQVGATDAIGAEPDGQTHVFACFHPVDGPSPIEERIAIANVTERSAPASLDVVPKVILSIDRLVKEYAVTKGAFRQRAIGSVKAVSDVSFSVREGETFGLVGESGCGKTTIGHLVVALERATSGAVHFDGDDVTQLRGAALRRKRRFMQLMFQDPYSSLDPRARVGTTVGEPLVVQHIGNANERHVSVDGLLQEVGLPANAAHLYPHEFSGGQRQRIGLARALALSPKLVVADEPVSALDDSPTSSSRTTSPSSATSRTTSV